VNPKTKIAKALKESKYNAKANTQTHRHEAFATWEYASHYTGDPADYGERVKRLVFTSNQIHITAVAGIYGNNQIQSRCLGGVVRADLEV
jgi:hypothetical protein